MLRADKGDGLQYGNMADNSGAERSSSRLYEIVRKRRALWWVGGAVLLIALVTVTWLARKWIPLSAPHKWTPFPSDWFMPLSLGAGALLALAILLAILWKVPQWQVGRVKRLNAKERFDRVNEARKTLATILGGIVLLAGFFGTWQNIKVAQESLTVSQQGQITDRFTNPHFSQALIWGCGGVLGELGRPFFDDDIVPWRFWSQRMAWFTLRRGFFGRAPPNDDGIAGGSVVV